MSNGELNQAEIAVVEKRMEIVEFEQAARTSNEVVQKCFCSCVQSFRSKQLDATETSCLTRCTEKYIDATNRIFSRFQEIQTLEENMLKK